MKKKIIIAVIIVVVISGFIALNVMKNNGTSSTFSGGISYEVKTKKIEKGTITSTVSASATVVEIEKFDLTFDTPTKVTKVLVEKNQRVSKGTKLVEIDLSDLDSQLQQARISKTTQELAIKKIRTLSGTRSTASLEAALTIAENSLKSAESAYDESVKAYNSSKELYSSGAISKNDLDRTEKAVKDAEIGVKNAKLNYNTALDNLTDLKKSNAQSNSSTGIDLDTQEQNLKATIMRIDELEAQKKRKIETVSSPIDGAVIEVNAVDGGYSTNMLPAVKVINPDKLKVKARVNEFNIKDVAVGQSVEITGDAVNKDEKVTGKVESIAPAAVKNMTSGGEETVVEVIVKIDTGSNLLRPGLNVTCNIFTKEKKDVIVADLSMFDEDKDGNKFIYVIEEKKNIMNRKAVKIGLTSDMTVEITEGLNEGDLAVVDPQPTYKDGARVKIINDTEK